MGGVDLRHYLAAFLAGLILLLTGTCIGQAAPGVPGVSPPTGDLPSLALPGGSIQAQTQLFLPKILTIHGFKFEVVAYTPGSTMKNASGTGKASFAGNGSLFDLPFSGVEIQGDSKQGEIIKGTITKLFNPKHPVTFGLTMNGFVKKLYLTPSDTKVDLEVPLPTLWTREKAPGSTEYLPAKQACLIFANFETTQDLDIFLPAYADHKLGQVGIGDTNIIMDCAGKPLFVDLSTKQPANNSPALTGVGFSNIKTVPRPELANTNIGYCFAEYLVVGAVGPQGFLGQLSLQNSWSYTTSLPQGHQFSLTKGNLNLLKSSIVTGVFFGQLQLPASVTTQAGARISCGFSSFAVDGNLDMKGLLPYKEAVYWGRPPAVQGQPPVPASYYLQSEQPAFVFFPGTTGGKADRTTIDTATQEEKFVNIYNDDISQVPGVTFASFNLGILTPDANNNPIELAFEALAYDPAMVAGTKGVFRPLSPKYGNTWWLNIGLAGVNGRVEIESALGTQDLQIALGYIGNVGPNTFTAYKLFKGFLHSKETPYTSAYTSDNYRKFGHFFQAAFVDSAVFDLGIDGHFEVGGPAEIKPDIYDLGATSTADLTSARVEIDAKLKFWDVAMKTANSRLVPKVNRVFFLGAELGEEAHYLKPYPVLWGQMIASGDIPELIFGYGRPQYFDGLPFSYTEVWLSPWNGNPMTPQTKWGALVAKGALNFPLFGAFNMRIDDYCWKTSDPTHKNQENRDITIDTDGNDNNAIKPTFAIDQGWGGTKARFIFPAIGYYDGLENEDGFRGDGRVTVSDLYFDQGQGLASKITLTSVGPVIAVDHQQTVPFKEPFKDELKLSYVKGEIKIDADSLPRIVLGANFIAGSKLLGGFQNGTYTVTITPALSIYDITAPINQNFGGVGLTGSDAHLNLAFGQGIFSGTLEFPRVEFAAGPVSGKAGGGFNVYFSPTAKYVQGYGEVTINGIPWPAPNSGGGAFVLAYKANPVDLYALSYVDRSKFASALGQEVSGFYMACKLGYDYSLAGLGSVNIYVNGGAGLFVGTPTQVVFHCGSSCGAEICGIGLECGYELLALKPLTNLNFDLRGTLYYELSLLFFDFAWQHTIRLTPDGIEVL